MYGILFILIGLPLLILDEKNSGLIIIPVVGAMLISIGAMIVYSVGIESKYRKKMIENIFLGRNNKEL